MVDYEANQETAAEQADYEQMRDDLDKALSYAEDAEAWATETDSPTAALMLTEATRLLRAAIASFEPPDDGPEILGRQGGMYVYA